MQSELKKAFEDTIFKCIIDTVPDMPDHVFSKRFEKEMNHLIKYGEPVSARKITPKKLFVCITAAIIAACIMGMSVGAVRDFLKNFFMDMFDTHTVVQSANYDEAPTSIESIYSLAFPDGFELTYKDELYEWSPFVSYHYYKDNEYIYFNQTVKSIYDVNINTEGHTLQYIDINGSDGYILDLDNDEFLITWDNGDYIFDLIGNIGKDELIKLAKSVQEVEK